MGVAWRYLYTTQKPIFQSSRTVLRVCEALGQKGLPDRRLHRGWIAAGDPRSVCTSYTSNGAELGDSQWLRKRPHLVACGDHPSKLPDVRRTVGQERYVDLCGRQGHRCEDEKGRSATLDNKTDS